MKWLLRSAELLIASQGGQVQGATLRMDEEVAEGLRCDPSAPDTAPDGMQDVQARRRLDENG